MTGTLLAWLAPAALGIGAVLLAMGRPRGHGAWCTLFGLGWVTGLLLLSWLILALEGVATPQQLVPRLAPWFLLVGVGAAFAGWRWRRPVRGLDLPPTPRWGWIVLAATALLLAWHGSLLLAEARLHPLFPWDAWKTWSVKPKTWFLLDAWVPFAEFGDWLAAGAAGLHTEAVPAYPELVGRLETWFASGAGCWCEPAFTVLWPSLWLALLVGGYGLLRSLGSHVAVAALAVWVLGSLPMLGLHVALPGYMDLWLAVVFGFTLLCWLHWQRCRHPGALVLALVLGLSLPAIKVEGSIWLVLWLAILVVGLLPRRWRRGGMLAAAAAVLLVGLGVVFAGFGVPIPGMGWVQVDANQLQITRWSSLHLGWQPVTRPVLASLFALPNWHLLFWLAPLVAAWRWRTLRKATGLGLMSLCLVGGCAFLFVLFFFTEAGLWAADQTSFNRLVLQLVPALVFTLALGFTAPEADEEDPHADHAPRRRSAAG